MLDELPPGPPPKPEGAPRRQPIGEFRVNQGNLHTRTDDAARREGHRLMCEQARRNVSDRCWHKLASAILKSQPRPRSAILLGPSGCGKTTAATYLCLGREAGWAKGHQLAVCEREHRLGAGEPQLVIDSMRAPMLVIDDLRAGQEVAALWRVIDRRYDMCLPTIVTTGLTRDGLQDHLGVAGLRRLTEQHAGERVLIVDCHGVAP